jgi:ABC-2 type transport system permease protein
MSKTLLVLKNEFLSVIQRKSFLITLFLLPVIGVVSMFVISAIEKSTGQDAGSILNNFFLSTVQADFEGFVDESGLVKAIPKGYENRLMRFTSETDARQALEQKVITAYYVISQDYLSTGNVIYVRPDFNPLGSTTQSLPIDALMAYALTDDNLDLAYRLQNPLNIQQQSLSTEVQRDVENPLTFIIPYVITFLFYISILTSSSLVLSSITDEKQNRVLEILMTSITPRQMLTGKIIALGLAGLIQTTVWLGSGLLMLRYSGRNFALADAFQLPASLLIWGAVYFLLGYAIYASLMAAIGALVPNLREASQATTLVILPLIVPLIFITSLIQTPNSGITIFLSLFPLTSPIAMMTRLSAVQVPFWQLAASLVLLMVTAVILIRATASMFRAQALLSGREFSVKILFRTLFQKAES